MLSLKKNISKGQNLVNKIFYLFYLSTVMVYEGCFVFVMLVFQMLGVLQGFDYFMENTSVCPFYKVISASFTTVSKLKCAQYCTVSFPICPQFAYEHATRNCLLFSDMFVSNALILDINGISIYTKSMPG